MNTSKHGGVGGGGGGGSNSSFGGTTSMINSSMMSASTSSIQSMTTTLPRTSANLNADGTSKTTSFEELVSKLFSCNIVLVMTDQARQFLKQSYGSTTFASILNQFASIGNLHSTIRDLNGHNAYSLQKLRFRFFDVDQFKSRPNGSALRKLHFDVIASMCNSYVNQADLDEEFSNMTISDKFSTNSSLSSSSLTAPWYDLWRNCFIDTFEPSDHDFIGSNCGCFFVITKHELPHYRVIFDRLCASVKQNSTLRFIQSDFVRYFIVLSDQILDTSLNTNNSGTDEYTKTCQELKVEFPNSFIFYIDSNNRHHEQQQQQQQQQTGSMFTIGDATTTSTSTSDMMSTDDGVSVGSSYSGHYSSVATDPLTVASLDFQQQNSRFYNELVSQRSALHQQQLNHQSNNVSGPGTTSVTTVSSSTVGGGGKDLVTSVSSTGSNSVSGEMFSDWLSSHGNHPDQLQQIAESIAETIDFMLREFITKSLIPWAERQIKILGELIAQRKGFRKSIFSATRSLISNMSSSTVSLTKTITGGTGVGGGGGGASSGVIYIPDAQEMQQRKLADICMIFGVYEMAYNLYYGSRKDFQGEGAWLYYAGASEMSAIAAYFVQKFHPNYFDQAIATYMDTCRSVNLATRTAILATELYCQVGRFIDAANLFIRLTGDDSDLRSALFLEQASKCFLQVSPNISRSVNSGNSSNNALMRTSISTQSILSALTKTTSSETVGDLGSRYRKAAFHYVLAGHRYNRCGLKHFALRCYRQFNYPHWEAAADHVNLTVAKLYLNIAATSSNRTMANFNNNNNSNSTLSKSAAYYLKGLDIYRTYSHKQSFFAELLKELKKFILPSSNDVVVGGGGGGGGGSAGQLQHHRNSLTTDLVLPNFVPPQSLYQLELPYVHHFTFVSFDSLQQTYADQPLIKGGLKQYQRNICYVGEPIRITFLLSSPFPLIISHIKLIANEESAKVLQLDPPDAAMVAVPISFDTPDKLVEVTLQLVVCEEIEFSLLGIEYYVDSNIKFQRRFPERIRQQLCFKSIRTLPLIPLQIEIPQLNLSAESLNCSATTGATTTVMPYASSCTIPVPVKVYGSEMITLRIFCQSIANWMPSTIALYTSAKNYHLWPEKGSSIPEEETAMTKASSGGQSSSYFSPLPAYIDSKFQQPAEENNLSVDNKQQQQQQDQQQVKRKPKSGGGTEPDEYQIPIQCGYNPIELQIHIPPKKARHIVSIRLHYEGDKDADGSGGDTKLSRTVLRKLAFEVVPCIDLEANYHQVVTLRNLCPNESIAVFDCTTGEDGQWEQKSTPMVEDYSANHNQTINNAYMLSAATVDANYVSIPVQHAAHLLLLKTFIRWTILPDAASLVGDSWQPRNGLILLNYPSATTTATITNA